VIPRIDAIAQVFQSGDTMQKCYAVYQILKVIFDGGMVKAVLNAMFGSLKWWDMLLYSVASMSAILGWFCTGPVLFVAQISAILVSGAFLLEDFTAALDCSFPIKALAANGAKCKCKGTSEA
jgi:hypothetical protein